MTREARRARDATRHIDLQPMLEGRLADAVWTDPPFNVAYEGAAGSIQNDALSDEVFAAFLGAAFRAAEGKRLTCRAAISSED